MEVAIPADISNNNNNNNSNSSNSHHTHTQTPIPLPLPQGIEKKKENKKKTMPPIQKYKISHPYLDISCGLGEAPFYEKSHNSLRFVDIVKKKLHTINLDEGVASHREFDLEFSIGTTADVEGVEGKFVFGGEVFFYSSFFSFGGQERGVVEGLIVASWW